VHFKAAPCGAGPSPLPEVCRDHGLAQPVRNSSWASLGPSFASGMGAWSFQQLRACEGQGTGQAERVAWAQMRQLHALKLWK